MNHVYLIGIGGIGMSALARYYHHAGAQVAGYDRTPSPLTRALEQEGMAVHYEDNMALVPEGFTAQPKDTLVIYTPAIPATHSELNYFKDHRFTLIKRAVALGRLAQNHQTLAIAGTHGKTTTSTLLAHILTHSGLGCTAFLGGISKNYHSNLLLSQNPALVAEADEFDRSFWQLYPQMAVITSTDADHLDIYGTHRAVKDAFVQFASQIQPGGVLVSKDTVELPWRLAPGVTHYRYSLSTPCHFYASHLRHGVLGIDTFDLHYLGHVLPNCRLGIPGALNIENAVAASALALSYGVSPQALKEALATFRGVERRMDIKVHNARICYIDDYAHHPEELRATINAVREWFPHQRLTGIFQPHLYTRTRDFAHELAQSLSLLDHAVLLPIYPARELPIEGVNSELLLAEITSARKDLVTPQEVLPLLERYPAEVLLTLGAGNIDRLVPQLTDYYTAKA